VRLLASYGTLVRSVFSGLAVPSGRPAEPITQLTSGWLRLVARPFLSVCSTVTRFARLEVFLGSMGAMTSREPKQSLDITSRRSEAVDLPAASAYGLVPGRPTPGSLTPLRHPIAQTLIWWSTDDSVLKTSR
jgi:hypothetical protein